MGDDTGTDNREGFRISTKQVDWDRVDLKSYALFALTERVERLCDLFEFYLREAYGYPDKGHQEHPEIKP